VNGERNGFGTHKYHTGDSYKGEYRDGLWDGQGVLHLTRCFYEGKSVNNLRYDGRFKRGKKVGLGKLTIDNLLDYQGEFQNDKFHGYGICKYTNGNVYEGYFEDGKWSGNGNMIYKNGDTYKGGFIRGLFHGTGVFKWARNGGSYTGDYFQGFRHGKGLRVYANNNKCQGIFKLDTIEGECNYSFANGDVYCGPMKNNQFNGYGILTIAKGGRYEGEFLNGKFYGKGKFTYPNGGFYDGEYNAVLDKYEHRVMFPNPNGLRHGKGLRVYPDGNKYDGYWKDDQMCGQGVFTWVNGESYTGEFLHGMKHGLGTFVYGRGDESEYVCPLGETHRGRVSCTYEGMWAKDTFHGHGKLKCVTGRYYVGEWCYGRRKGQGTMSYIPVGQSGDPKHMYMGGVDGMYRTKEYVGNWDDDQPHGGGTLIYCDGVRITGNLIRGKLTGRCKYEFPTGRVSYAEFENGNRVRWLEVDVKHDGTSAAEKQEAVVNYLTSTIGGLKPRDKTNK
jgi:hypothetical protein